MQKLSPLAIFLSLMIFSGCQKYYISVSQERVDSNYLASTQAKTPDPRQENPPRGEQLVLEWKVPAELLSQEPRLYLHVIYQDYTEQYFSYPMPHRMGYAVYRLLGEEYSSKKGLLTYETKIQTKTGEVFRDWKHQLFTRLIVLDKEEDVIIQEEQEDEWGVFPSKVYTIDKQLPEQ